MPADTIRPPKHRVEELRELKRRFPKKHYWQLYEMLVRGERPTTQLDVLLLVVDDAVQLTGEPDQKKLFRNLGVALRRMPAIDIDRAICALIARHDQEAS